MEDVGKSFPRAFPQKPVEKWRTPERSDTKDLTCCGPRQAESFPQIMHKPCSLLRELFSSCLFCFFPPIIHRFILLIFMSIGSHQGARPRETTLCAKAATSGGPADERLDPGSTCIYSASYPPKRHSVVYAGLAIDTGSMFLAIPKSQSRESAGDDALRERSIMLYTCHIRWQRRSSATGDDNE